MMQGIGRAFATAVLAAVAGAVAAVVLYAWHPAINVEFDRDLSKNVEGFYPSERDQASGLTFAWTGPDALIRLPGLDRRLPWMLTLRVRSLRPNPATHPDVTLLADGVDVATAHTGTEFKEITATIPALSNRRGLTLGLHSSNTFVPGKADPRTLGIMVDRVALAPSGPVLLPTQAIGAAALSSAAMGAALAVLGMTAGSAIGGAVLLSAGDAAVVAHGFGPFSGYPATVAAVGCWIALVLALVALAFRYARPEPLRNTARFAIAFTASALFLKMLVLLHPDMPIGDALFQAHRFELVLAGRLYFTSIAPGGYAFPYAPGLYVFASLFAPLVHRGAGDVVLLRIVTLSLDAVVAALLYRAIVAASEDRLAAAMSVALYHLIPLDFSIVTTGNLTNAFAQSLSVVALVLMASSAVRLDRAAATASFGLVLLAAFLSHTSTVAILFVSSIAIAALFWSRSTPEFRSSAAAIAGAAVVAGVLSVVLYYGHFMETYRTQFARIGHETVTSAPVVGHRTLADRFEAVPYFLNICYGVPAIVLGVLGSASLSRRLWPDRLTLTIAGWLAGCAVFLIVGILTPIDMRYYLAAIPAVALLGSAGAAAAWSRGAVWRGVAIALLAGAVATGVHTWWSPLT
jgi:hypothetical protein